MDCLSHLGKFEAFLCLIDHNWCIGEGGGGGFRYINGKCSGLLRLMYTVIKAKVY